MKLTPTLFLSVLTVACVLAEQQQQADGQDHHPEHQHILENSVADIVPAQPVAPETNQPSSTDDRLDIDYYRIPAIGVHEDFYTSPKFSIEISDIIPASLAAGLGKQESSMLITGKNNEKFLCQIPPHSPRRRLSSPPPPQANSTASNTTDPQAVRSTTTILSEAIKALAPMKSNCLYILQGWWTFEFCHASHIRQFHQDQPTEQQPNPPKFEFMMGRFDLDTMTSAELGESSSSGAVGGLRGRYVSIRVRDGTVCDLTGKKRETQVKFYCNPNSGLPDRMSSVAEIATCTYLVVIQTARLCSIPEFAPVDDDGPEKIGCKKIVSDDFYTLEKQRLAENARKREQQRQKLSQQAVNVETGKQEAPPPIAVIEEILRRAVPLFSTATKNTGGDKQQKAGKNKQSAAADAAVAASDKNSASAKNKQMTPPHQQQQSGEAGQEFVVKYGAGDEAIDVRVIYQDIEGNDEQQSADTPPFDTEKLAELLSSGLRNLHQQVSAGADSGPVDFGDSADEKESSESDDEGDAGNKQKTSHDEL